MRECKGLEFTKSQRTVESREILRKLLVKSYVLPQRPPQLRDMRRWMCDSAVHCERELRGSKIAVALPATPIRRNELFV